jgi:hypothetical protein
LTYAQSPNITKPIISYQSISQSAKQYTFSYSTAACLSTDSFGACLGANNANTWNSQYWAFWRAGVKLEVNNPTAEQYKVTAGWITVEYGCNYSFKDASTNKTSYKIKDSSTVAGSWPLINQSINNVFMPIMISDGVRYD